MKKMRFCSVCRKYTLEKIHCNRLSISAHPLPFKPMDIYGDYRRANASLSGKKLGSGDGSGDDGVAV